MKANELRIGNCILFESEGTNFIVKAIDNKGFEVYNQLESTWIEHDQFGGIPLTEEWLIKFAIKIDHDISDVFCIEINNSLRTTVYILKVKNGWSIEIGSRSNGMVSFRSEIQYVHQLQNLYFALTGNELTINA